MNQKLCIFIFFLFNLYIVLIYLIKFQITNFITNKLVLFEDLSYKILKKQNNFIKYISNNNYLNDNQKKFIIKIYLFNQKRK